MVHYTECTPFCTWPFTSRKVAWLGHYCLDSVTKLLGFQVLLECVAWGNYSILLYFGLLACKMKLVTVLQSRHRFED